MKKSYYVFSTDKPITKCKECPVMDIEVITRWCRLLCRPVDLSGKALKPMDCPLHMIEGKVEQ